MEDDDVAAGEEEDARRGDRVVFMINLVGDAL